MKKFASGLLVAGLSFATAFAGIMPASAASPVAKPSLPALADGSKPVLNVQYTERELRRLRRADRVERRIERRAERRARAVERRGDRYFYNGYRGYRDRRAGYRYYDGYWFPTAAFVAGALVTGAIANANRGGSHTEWCYNRYRSYRASDNTFQPNSGPRRQCVSPY